MGSPSCYLRGASTMLGARRKCSRPGPNSASARAARGASAEDYPCTKKIESKRVLAAREPHLEAEGLLALALAPYYLQAHGLAARAATAGYGDRGHARLGPERREGRVARARQS